MRALPAIALAALAVTAISTPPASAGITCNGPYQYVDGNEIASPYCQDNHLARIARSYGMRVSNRAIRWDASVKSEACRLVGHDNRVSSICAGEMNDYFRNRGGRR